MAASDNYIGVAMGLDVTDLKAGLSEANKRIQLANSEFKRVSSSMDDWTKSTEGISAKIKQLDSVLGMQKAKLSGLKAEYEKVAKEQGENSEAARKLKVQINQQEAVVNATSRELANYNLTLKQAEEGTIDLEQVTLRSGRAVSKMGDAAAESGDGFTIAKGAIATFIGNGLTALVGGIKNAVTSVLGLASSTREVRENFAKLETGFTTAGHSAEDAANTYNELYGILGDEGQATEAAAHLAQLTSNEKELADWTNIAAGVYATFGDSLPIEGLTEAANETAKTGQLTGGLADALNWAGVSEDEFQAKLDAAATEQERQALITETLNGLYSEQSAKFKELNKDVIAAREADAQLNKVLAELGAIAEPIMTTLKLLAVDLLENIKPFVELIGEGLNGALQGSAGATDMLAEGLSGLLGSLSEKITGLLPTVISTLASVATSLLPQLLSTITGLIPPLVSAIGGMLPELIPIAIDAVLTIVETLLDNIDMLIDSGIELLMGLADGLIAALPRLIDKAPVIIGKLVGAISRNLPKLVQAGIDLIVKLAAGLIQAIPQLVSKIPEIISSLISGFSDYYSDLGEVGMGLLEGIWQGIKDGASWLKDKIFGFAGDVAGWFQETFKIGSPSKLMADEVGVYIGEGVGVGVLDSLPTVKKQLGKFAGYVQDNLGGIKSNLAITTSAAGGGVAGIVGGSTVVNAGLTVHYNGALSRKQLKQLENDNYNSIKMRLKAEGAI